MANFTRRALLAALPGAASVGAMSSTAMAAGHGDGFTYEVTRTEEEWRAMLDEAEYAILRRGGTEVPKSDPLWESTEPGMYHCKGCDLPVYDARWKVVVPVGFLFYRHSEENAVLTSIDRSIYGRFGGRQTSEGPLVPEGLSEADLEALDSLLQIEVHCRRCGSHFGHILIVQGKLLHCINGTALNFAPDAA